MFDQLYMIVTNNILEFHKVNSPKNPLSMYNTQHKNILDVQMDKNMIATKVHVEKQNVGSRKNGLKRESCYTCKKQSTSHSPTSQPFGPCKQSLSVVVCLGLTSLRQSSN